MKERNCCMNIKSPNGDYEYTSEDIEIVEILLRRLSNKIETITYTELSEQVSTHPNPHFGFNTPLLKIGFLCHQLDLPFITCCVITANKKPPGEGIRHLYKECGIILDGKSDKEIYDNEREKVRSCNEWQRLADYLGINIHMPLNGEVIYPDDIDDKAVFAEGAKKRITVNKYERDRNARNKCIEYYAQKDGCVKCQICGFDFGKKYGDAYRNIIQVHHIVPLSKIDKNYEVNPKKDLIPVCPNCHVVLHSKVGETVDELRNRLHENI